MSSDQGPTVDQKGWSVRTALVILALLAAIIIAVAATISMTSSLREANYQALDKSLTEKYGVTIVGPHGDRRNYRVGIVAPWTVDGEMRRCIVDRDPLKLRCNDGSGAITEVEKG